MIIGVPKEIKPGEHRVSTTPAAVRELTGNGHRVLMEAGAGVTSGFSDDQFGKAGAQVMERAADVWTGAEMVIKVKEPTASEYRYFREDLILFTFLHLAADRPLTESLLHSGITALAYETLETKDGRLPLLRPMSEIAGKIGAQEAAGLMAHHRGGKGKLIGGAAGVPPATVIVIGAGTSGLAAAETAMGMGARVLIYDINIDKLREIRRYYKNCTTVYSAEQNIADRLPEADIVLGCVLVPGAKAPRVISREMVKTMAAGSVIVDIAIDQGGCVETSRPTTHADPAYVTEGVLHYCVTNMPGAMPQTATIALSNASLPWILKIARADDLTRLIETNRIFRKALNTCKGKLTNRSVAEALDLRYEGFAEESPLRFGPFT